MAGIEQHCVRAWLRAGARLVVGALVVGAPVVLEGCLAGISWQPASPAISASVQIIFLVVVTFLLNNMAMTGLTQSAISLRQNGTLSSFVVRFLRFTSAKNEPQINGKYHAATGE